MSVTDERLVWLRGGLAVPEAAYLLMLDFERLGIDIRQDGPDVLVGPVSKLTPEHHAALRAHKADLLHLLAYCTRTDLDAHLFSDRPAKALHA